MIEVGRVQKIPPTTKLGVPAIFRLVGLRRSAILVSCALMLLICVGLSLAIGSSNIPLSQVIHYLQYPDGSNDSYIVNEVRMNRTVLGILVGASLAVAGAVMQSITRNPLADPGLLGVNSGASLAIVLGATIGLDTSTGSQIILAFLGALLASLVVYAIGNMGRNGGSPLRLVLAGIAFSTASGGIIGALLIINPRVFDTFRFWDVGALTRTEISLWSLIIPMALGFIVIGFIISALSSLDLGDEMAIALGTKVARTRLLALISLTLLCATATAAAGPISFVGLMIPYFAGIIIGKNRGWIILTCALLGPILMLSADVLGRIIIRPTEMQVGLLTAFVGSPVLLFLVLRMRGLNAS